MCAGIRRSPGIVENASSVESVKTRCCVDAHLCPANGKGYFWTIKKNVNMWRERSCIRFSRAAGEVGGGAIAPAAFCTAIRNTAEERLQEASRPYDRSTEKKKKLKRKITPTA